MPTLLPGIFSFLLKKMYHFFTAIVRSRTKNRTSQSLRLDLALSGNKGHRTPISKNDVTHDVERLAKYK
jgi:hypothetical protein